MKVKLSNKELSVIKEIANRFSFDLKTILSKSGISFLDISEEAAIDLRELCSDYLTEVGFDINYEPNEKGIIIEDLIDKLFIK